MERQTYAALRQQASAIGERNDYTVKAVAVVAGAPYMAAHATLRRLGRPNGRGCNDSVWLPAVRELGCEYTDVTRWARSAGARTVTSAEAVLRRAGGRYLIRTSGHLLAFDGEHVQDWTRGRRHRVLQVLRITGDGYTAPAEPETPTPAPSAPSAPQRPTEPAEPIRRRVDQPRRERPRDAIAVAHVAAAIRAWQNSPTY